jgi:hypothetical protein
MSCRVTGRSPVSCPRVRRSARLPPPFENLDDDHASATAGTWRADVWFARCRLALWREISGNLLAFDT